MLEEEVEREDSVIYSDVYNLFFDRPITAIDIEELKKLFSTPNGLHQIYIKNLIDIKSILDIKYLLEIAPATNDSNIEKYILGVKASLEELCSINYQNPSTWQIAYQYENERYKVANVVMCRRLLEVLGDIKEDIKGYSQFERIVYITNWLKKYKVSDIPDKTIPEIIDKEECSSNDIYDLFDYLLKEDIPHYIFKYEDYRIAVINIDDNKYDIHGYYFWKANNNMLSLEEISDEDKIQILKTNDLDYAFRSLAILEEKSGINYFEGLERNFNSRIDDIIVKMNKTTPIMDDDLTSANKFILDIKKTKHLSKSDV